MTAARAATPAQTPAHGQASTPTDWTKVTSSGGFDEEGMESSVAAALTLKDHLEAQLAIAALMPEDRMICMALIDGIDEAGYLRAELPDLVQKLGCEIEDIQAVLGVLQGFDPVGVGARDLSECLSLQLRGRDRLDPAMAMLLTRLDLVARRDLTQLAALCGVDGEDIADMLVEIRTLNPKPGLAFGAEQVAPVVPDVFVRVGNDGGWNVELNSDTLPRLLVNSRYYAQVSKGARDKESKTYLLDCLNNANWLVKSLDQRAPRTASSRSPARSCASRMPSSPMACGTSAAQSAHDRRRHLDAQIDRQPRHLQQIHRATPRGPCSS